VDFGGDDLTSKASEEFLVLFDSSTDFSVCSNGFLAPFRWGVAFPVSGGDTIDLGYLPEYFNVGNSLYVSIINITASIVNN
jgi:hypothetical protein